MDVERAADSYAQGWTLRQIGAELGSHFAAVSQPLHRAGVTMRRGAPAHPTSAVQAAQDFAPSIRPLKTPLFTMCFSQGFGH
jgi:hypothetical protein